MEWALEVNLMGEQFVGLQEGGNSDTLSLQILACHGISGEVELAGYLEVSSHPQYYWFACDETRWLCFLERPFSPPLKVNLVFLGYASGHAQVYFLFFPETWTDFSCAPHSAEEYQILVTDLMVDSRMENSHAYVAILLGFGESSVWNDMPAAGYEAMYTECSALFGESMKKALLDDHKMKEGFAWPCSD